LIELLVAMSLFAIFVAISSGGFIRALRTQRAITALISVNDNTSLVLEQMSREMRTGYNFCTGRQRIPEITLCQDLRGDELMFVNANNQIVFYRWDNQAIYRGVADATLSKNYSQITGENVRVRNFNIELLGNRNSDGFPPRITMSVTVSPKSDSSYLQNIYTNMQTTVSSRSLDS